LNGRELTLSYNAGYQPLRSSLELGGGQLLITGSYLQTSGTTNVGAGGTLTVGGSYSLAGTMNSLGSLDVAGGTVEVVGTFQQGAWTTVSVALSMLRSSGVVKNDGDFFLGGGVVDVGLGVFSNQGGALRGSGNLMGDLTNQGTLAIGDTATAGTLGVSGNFTQGENGVLSLLLTGPDAGAYDRLTVGGDVALGGTVQIILAPGYLPMVGTDRFDFLLFGGQRQAPRPILQPFGTAADYTWHLDDTVNGLFTLWV
jgi:hypothetical protein